MKNIILILLTILLLGKPLAANATIEYTSGGAQISLDKWGRCVLENENISCTGIYKSNMPLFKKPTQISVGQGMACAIDKRRVKCWGSNDHYETPAYQKDPILISANSPELVEPLRISVGVGFVCVIDDTKVKCWDEKYQWEDKSPFGYDYIDVNYRTICASHGKPGWEYNSGRCWYHPNLHLSGGYPIETKKKFKTGERGVCSINENYVDCFIPGGPSGHNSLEYKWEVKNAKYLGFFEGYFCAIDDEGKICKSESITSNAYRYFSIRLATQTLPFNKRLFLESLMKFDNYFCALDKEVCVELLSNIVSPLILTHESKYYKDILIPKFEKWKSQANLINIKDNLENRKISLTAIQSSLDVSLRFLSEQQIDRTQDALRKVGQAMIDTMNDQNVLEAVKSVESLTEERAVLLSSDKSKFLIECQQVAIDWLKLKVK